MTQRLIAIYTVHSTAMELHNQVDIMESDSPDQIYPTLVSPIVEDYRQLQTIIRRSAIPASHSSRGIVTDLDSHNHQLIDLLHWI